MAVKYEEIPEAIRGEANDVIAAKIQTLTKGRIQLSQLRFKIGEMEAGLVWLDHRTKLLKGRLIKFLDQYSASTNPAIQELVEFVNKFVNYTMETNNVTIDTTDLAWSEPIYNALQALRSLDIIVSALDAVPPVVEKVIYQQHVDAFYSSDGGLKWPDGVTAQHVADAKAEKVAADAAASNTNAVNTAWTEKCSAVVGHLTPNPVYDMNAFRACIQAFLTAIGG